MVILVRKLVEKVANIQEEGENRSKPVIKRKSGCLDAKYKEMSNNSMLLPDIFKVFWFGYYPVFDCYINLNMKLNLSPFSEADV